MSRSKINWQTLVLGICILVSCNCAILHLAQADELGGGFAACQEGSSQLSDFTIRRAPKDILLVPLLYRNPDVVRENAHWPEPYARRLEAFYRARYHARVTFLRNIRTWKDYYTQTDELRQRGARFDRAIFIAHGGYDGPILNTDILREDRTQQGEQIQVLQLTEAQPGNQHVIALSYKPHENPAFAEYVDRNWQALLQMPPNEAKATLRRMRQQLQPVDNICFNKFCPSSKLQAMPEASRKERLDSCDQVCRKSLYDIKYYEEASEARFSLYADSLRDLVKADGLIFLGECNAGTATPKQYSHWDTPGIVVSSKIAGGPYQNYVHLLSNATTRTVAGPIGKSSAEDIVKRIMALENNHEQRYLCVAQPLNRFSVLQSDF